MMASGIGAVLIRHLVYAPQHHGQVRFMIILEVFGLILNHFRVAHSTFRTYVRLRHKGTTLLLQYLDKSS